MLKHKIPILPAVYANFLRLKTATISQVRTACAVLPLKDCFVPPLDFIFLHLLNMQRETNCEMQLLFVERAMFPHLLNQLTPLWSSLGLTKPPKPVAMLLGQLSQSLPCTPLSMHVSIQSTETAGQWLIPKHRSQKPEHQHSFLSDDEFLVRAKQQKESRSLWNIPRNSLPKHPVIDLQPKVKI